MNALTAVLMTITLWVPNGASLKQAWQIVEITEMTTLEHCVQMNRMFAQGGTSAVMTVRCEARP